MKTKIISFILLTLLFNVLFYEQYIGVNIALFQTAVFLLFGIPKKFKFTKEQITVSLLSFGAALGCLLYGSFIAFGVYVLSFLIFISIIHEAKLSYFSGSLLGALSLTVSSINQLFTPREKTAESEGKTKKRIDPFLLMGVFGIFAIFLGIYALSNPLFGDLLAKINLDFISIKWVFFTLISAYFLFGIIYFLKEKSIITWDLNNKTTLTNESNEGLFKNIDLIKAGVLLFGLLNFLLLFVNGLDIFYYFIKPELLEGVNFSKALHQSIGAIITSVIFAISLILYFLKNRLNFDSRNKYLIRFIYVWIIQNAILIFIATYKNAIYIDNYGLTFKRLGVYIYLTLTIIGLIITTIKVIKLKTNWYIFKTMSFVFVLFFVLYSNVNWEKVIINNNIKALKEREVYLDTYYLMRFSKNSIPDLIKIKEENLIPATEKEDFERRLNKKIKHYIQTRKYDWQSWHWQLNEIDKSIINYCKN